MPVERLTHPRIGHSQKVAALTDVEFRVWDTYRWCADDFGVMARSAAKLQGDNDALDRHPREVISAALDRCVALDLIVGFDHQGQLYVCSLTWQTHQRIRRPRATFLPCPPLQVLEQMDDATVELFRKFHERFPKDFGSRARPRAALAIAIATAEKLVVPNSEKAEPRDTTSRAVPSRDVTTENAPPLDVWLADLMASYPATRVTSGYLTSSAFHEVFHRDPRPPGEVWTEMRDNLTNQMQGYEWRVKRMIPTLDKWLREGRWRQRHEVEPADAMTDATRGTLAALDSILREKGNP